jgi:hypothetical protein
MNFARLTLAAVVTWVVYMVLGYVVNEILLANVLQQNAAAFRSQEAIMGGLPLGFGFGLVGFFAFAYAYAKGYEGGNGMVEGMRFGVLVGILLNCFGTVWQYVVYPISSQLFTIMLIDYIVEFAIYGMIVGYLYKPAPVTVR